METIGGVLGVFGHDGSYDGTDEAGGDDLTLAHFLAREAGFEEIGKTFLHGGIS